MFRSTPVRPELVEGLFFLLCAGAEEVQCFDKLSTSGVCA